MKRKSAAAVVKSGKSKKIGFRTDVEALEARVMLSVAAEAGGNRTDSAHRVELAPGPQVGQRTQDLIVVDAALALRGLLPASTTRARVVLLDDRSDVLAQITAALKSTRNVQTLHILTHGSAGEIRVGDQLINAKTLGRRTGEVKKWAASLTETASIAVYGCDIADGASGRAFVRALAKRTGATVAASTDLTGSAKRGGDWTLEYVSGNDAVTPMAFTGFDGLLATFTVTASGGNTTYVAGSGDKVVDVGLTVASSDSAATYTSATVGIAAGLKSGQDSLYLGSPPAGFSGSYNSGSGVLTVTAAGGKTAAEFQAALRLVRYANSQSGAVDLTTRTVRFAFNGVTSDKAVAVDLPVDSKIQARLVDAFDVIDDIGRRIVNANAQPSLGSATEIPVLGQRITDLLYPNGDALDSNGNPVADWGKSVQPAGIGQYLRMKSTVQNYFTSAGTTITDLSGLQAALAAFLSNTVGGNQAKLDVTAAFNKPVTSDSRSIDLTVTILTAKGEQQPLQLEQLARDLNMAFGNNAKVEVGGGADISFTISLNLTGHVYGAAATDVPAGNVGVSFARLNAFAGYTLDPTPFDVTIGAIRGQVTSASGQVGVTIPVNLGGGGYTRTLSSWAADGADYAGFGTATGRANVVLPIAASIGGVGVTSSHTKIVYSDNNLFDATSPTYSTVDFDNLKYFATIRIDDVINQVLKVGDLMDGLSNSGENQFGLFVPTLDATKLGDLFDFKSLFASAIGAKVDIYEPTIATGGRDALTDYRLPLSSDGTPVPATWSDLRAGYSFGVVLNEAYGVTRVIVAADDTRQTLDDLVTDLNASFTTAGLSLKAVNVKNKLQIKATSVAIQRFAVVPDATSAGQQSPTAAPATGSGLVLNAPQYYTVTGSTSGSVTGTNYYTLGSSIAAAAVHSGILAAGASGVVKVTRLSARDVVASTRNGVTSAGGNGDVFLIESGVSDLRRLGSVDYTAPLTVLEGLDGNTIRATRPLSANLDGNAAIVINDGTTDHRIDVADNARTTLADTLTDVRAALIIAGIDAANLDARLVDAKGNTPDGTPAANTSYYLQFYTPDGSAWTTFSLKTVGDAGAYRVLPLGFLSGETATRPRPEALKAFNDFSNASLFPGITISPVYDATNKTVTLEFTASQDASPTVKAAINLATRQLGKIEYGGTGDLTFTADLHSELSFGLRFSVGPEKPVAIASGQDLPADGRLTDDANFGVNFVMMDHYAVSLPSGWTSSNASVQDLISDLNRALKSSTNGSGATEDLAERFIARRLEDQKQFELTNATPLNGGAAYAPTHTNGKLAADLTMHFTFDGKSTAVTVTAASTSDNTNFADLMIDVNAALGTAVVGGTTTSLVGQAFATTIAGPGGATNSDIYFYSTVPASVTWPTSVVLSAARTSAFVTKFGFDDSLDSDTSFITARAATSDAKLVAHSNGKPLASGTVEVDYGTFAGNAAYGFNTLNFAATEGGLTAGASVSLGNAANTIDEVAANFDGRLVRSLTGADGTGRARASMTLKDISSDGATIANNATIGLSVPDFGATTVIEDEAVGVPIAVAGHVAGKLVTDRTINFLYEGSAYAVTVTEAESANNTSFADLAAQFDAGLATATKTAGGVSTVVDISGQFSIGVDPDANNQVIVAVATATANPDFARATFDPGLAAFGEIAQQGSFNLDTVADSLTDVIPLLDGLQSDLDLFSVFKLPLVDLHVNDLIDVKNGLIQKIDGLRDVKISGPSQIAGALSQTLGVPTDNVAVTYDDDKKAYRIDLQWDTGVATAKAMHLSLAELYRFAGETPPESLSGFDDTGSASPLAIKIKAVTTLAVGIDLSDPENPRTFLYGHDGSDDTQLDDGSANGTSIALEVEAKADNITFTAALGAFGVFVRGGSASLGGAARTFNDDPIYTFDEKTGQLHFATDSDGAVLTVKLGEAGETYYLEPQAGEGDAYDKDNYATSYNGTVEANLPVYLPTEFINPYSNRTEHVRIAGQGLVDVKPGGNIFQLHIGDLQAYADATLDLVNYQREISDIYADAGNGSLSNAQQSAVNGLQNDIADLKDAEVLEVFTPDIDDEVSGIKAPTLLDIVRDPAILVDGIDTALGSVETGLKALDNLNIPLIGNVLGDAVDGVFNWRKGWLLDLKHELRGSGESFFQTLKENVYDFLGPSGADLLLKDNGIRSLDAFQKADSADDVTFDFLDEDGEKMTGNGGYGAHAMEFKVHLGQLLLNTGTDISFNLDALKPAFSLAINGGLTFKLGWDMTIGFGVSLEDGFYVVTDSDPTANELELRFEAGLSGRQTGFVVAERAQSLTGYSIQDAAGAWVYGPKDGHGNSTILDVMPVDENGDDYDFSLGLPDLPQDCSAEELAADDPGRVYWVVAKADAHGDAEAAYVDKLGQFRAMAGDGWVATNGGDDARNPDQMVEYNQTAPFAAYGSLFALNVAAIDTIKTGLHAKGDADYYYEGAAGQITARQRNDADTGVNRNNDLPTRIAGRIGVNIEDPSAAAEDYVARPGPSETGFVLMDGSNALGGEPVLDDGGAMIPVKYIGDDWYVMEPDPDAIEGEPDPELVEAYLMNEDQSPNRITYSELREAGTSIFELKVNAEAVLNLKMTLTVSDNAAIPKITADLNVDWRSDSMKPPSNPFDTSEEEQKDLVPELGVNNIRLDLGSFLTKFIKPIAEEMDKDLKPLDPLIKVLKTPLPVLTQLAGRDIMLSTLLTTFGGAKGQAVATLLDMVVLIRELSGVMAAVPGDTNVYLPIGNFWLAKVGAGPFGRPGLGKQIYYDNSEVTAPSITQRNQSMIADSGNALTTATNALGKLDALDKGSSSQPGVSSGDRGGFNIPVLKDPMTLFKLLMGENVPLVTFALPKLDFNFSTDIPLARIVILQIGLRFNLQMKGQLAVGYDTYGLKLFKDSHDPQDLLEGFYVSDRANADGTGADVDEFYLRASIALYGEVDLVLAKAGIEGGFAFEAHINLNDPDNDGKLRVMEAVDLVRYTHNPLDLADLNFSGEIYAKYYYWVGLKIWTPWKTYQITLVEGGKTFARLQVFSFTREGRDGPPVLAAKVTTVLEDGTQQPDSLLLNVGPNSEKRISNEDPLKLADAAERMTIWNDSPGSKTIRVRYDNYSGSYVKSFDNVNRVVVYGGQGNDTIDATGLNGIPVEFDGGDGDDTIYLGSGSAAIETIIKGGAGRDTIKTFGGGKMRVEGGDGDDSITLGDGGQVTVDGGNGNDTIVVGGGGGHNTFKFSKSFGKDNVLLNSTALVNLIDFIDSSLPVTANLHAADSVAKAGDTNSVNFDVSKATEIRGSDARDTFNVTDPTTRAANGGRGLVLAGGPGDDTYNITADDVSAMNADGITIDDEIAPTAEATIGDTEIDECGCLKKINVANAGSGYVTEPEVLIQDPTGSGARAVASIDKNGRVTGIYVLAKGENYANPTITLVRDISTGDKINYKSTGTQTVSYDRQANGATESQLKKQGKTFKWVGNDNPGAIRPLIYNINEIDKLNISLPAATLELNDAIDLTDKLEIAAKRFDQNATINADTVSITTDRGFAADHPINATNNGDVTLRITGDVDANDITRQARITATVVGGVITAMNIVSGGSGYKFAPTITIDDPRGAGARATTTVTNGVVTGITILDGGTGYLQRPGPKIVVAHPDSIQLNDDLTSSTVGSLPGDGDGRGTVTLRAENGAINNSGDVAFSSNNKILWEHGDYRYTSSKTLDDITPTTDTATVGGYDATAVAVLDSDGQVTAINVVNGGTGYRREFLPTVQIEGGATATAIVDDVTGTLTGFRVTYPGEGYGRTPLVKIISNGFGKIVGTSPAETVANRKVIKAAGGTLIASAFQDIGSSSKPIKTDVENMVAQNFDNGSAIYVLEKDGVRIGEQNHINGIKTVNGDIGVTTFNGAISLGQPVQQTNANGELVWQDAAKTIPIYAKDENGKIIYKGGQLAAGTAGIKLTADDIDVNSYVGAAGGTLTLQPVNPKAVIGLNGTAARARLGIDSAGHVTGTTELWSGRGYNAIPLVNIAAPGERAYGVADVMNGRLTGVKVNFGGTNYNADYSPTITLTGGGLNGATPGTPATAHAEFDPDTGAVTQVVIDTPGSGYYSAPTVKFALPGIQATALTQTINGRVTEVQIMNPGANYKAAPEIKIAAPVDFSLEKEEVEYFQDGFGNILIGRQDGRHVFYSADAGFVDGVTLRGPREGGSVELENLHSNNGPVVVIGSGHTLNLTSTSPTVEGTFVEIDDNVVVHDGVNAVITGTTDYVSVFGAGKGKIDGVAGSQSENLTITDVGNILVAGAIGSVNPIHDLTLNSSNAGTITLQQSVTIEGDLHIVKGGDVNFGGNVSIGGKLIIDEGANVSIGGTLTVGGDLTITKGGVVTFARNVSCGGNVTIGDSTNPMAVEGVTFSATARLDAAGAVKIYAADDIVFGNRVGQFTQPAGITLYSQTGDVSFQASVNTPSGALTIQKARDATFAQEVTAATIDIQNATGQARFERAVVTNSATITATSLVQIKNRFDVKAGSLTVTSDDVDFAGGTGSINYLGNIASTFTIRPRTLTRDITIGSPSGVFSALDVSDVDLNAIAGNFGELAIGNAAAGTGMVTIGTIGSQQGNGVSQLLMNTRIYGGSVTVQQAIDSAAGTGDLKMVARTGNIVVNAKINGTGTERNANVMFQTLAGNILLNQPVYAGSTVLAYSAGTVVEGDNAFISADKLGVNAVGAVTLTNAGNIIRTLAITTASSVIDFRNDTAYTVGTVDTVNGVNSGTAATTLASVGGTVTQTQPITAASLLLKGTGSTYTLTLPTNDVDTLAADVGTLSFVDADDLTVGSVNGKNGIATVGNCTLTAATNLQVNRNIATTTGDIVLKATAGTFTLDTAASLTAGGSGKVAIDSNGDMTVGNVTAGGDFTVNTPANFTQPNGTAMSIGGNVSIIAVHAISTDTVTTHGNLTLRAGDDLLINDTIDSRGTVDGSSVLGNVAMGTDGRAVATGNVKLVAGVNATIDTITALGNVMIQATGPVVLNDATSAVGTLTVETPSTITVNDDVTSGGDLSLTSTSNAAILIDLGAVLSTTTTGDIRISGGAVSLGNVTSAVHTVVHAVGAFAMYDGTSMAVGGAVSITADAAIATQAITAHGNITLRAGTSLAINAELNSRGVVDVGATNNDVTMTADASVSAGGNAIFTAGRNVISDAVTATGIVTFTGNDTVVTNDAITAGVAVNVTAMNGATIKGAISATTSDVRIEASHGMVSTTAGGTLSAGQNLIIKAPAAVVIRDNATAKGMLEIRATIGAVEVAVDARLTTSRTGAMGIFAATDVVVGNVTAGGDVTVVAGDDFAMHDSTAMTVAGATSIISSGDLSTEAITGRGNVSLRAGHALMINDAIDSRAALDARSLRDDVSMASTASLASGGDLTLTSAHDLTADRITGTGVTRLTAANGVLLNDAVATLGGNLTIKATAGSIVAASNGTIAADGAGSVFLESHTDTTVATITTGTGGLGVIAGGAVTMPEGGIFTVGGVTSITGGTDVSAEAISSTGNLTLRAGDGLSINAALASRHTIDAAAADGSISMAADSSVTAVGNIVLASSDDVSLAVITAGGDVAVNAADQLAIGDDMAANGDVSLITAGGAIITAVDATVVSANGAVGMRSGGQLQVRTIEAATNVGLVGKAGVGISGDVTAKTGVLSVTSRNGDIAMLAGFATKSAKQAAFAAAGRVSLSTITAGGVAIVAGADSVLGGVITSTTGGAVTTNITGKLNINEGADIVSTGVVTVAASGGVMTAADIDTGGTAVTFKSPLLLGDNVAISTGKRGDGTITFENSVDGNYDLALKSPQDITFAGDVGQADKLRSIEVVNARNVNLNGRMTAGSIEQDAGTGTTTFAGQIAALDAAGMAIKTAAVRVTGAMATTANGAQTKLTANSVRLTRTARVSSGGDFSVTANEVLGDDGYRVSVENGRNLILTADMLTLGSKADALSGTGLAVLQPMGDSTAVSLGQTGAAFDITADEANTLSANFSKVIVGRAQDADFDSGSGGNNAVTIGTIAFKSPLSVRSNGGRGTINVTGTLSSGIRGGHLSLTAGSDINVAGTIRAARSGDIRIVADTDSNGRGLVRVSGTMRASVSTKSGNVTILGPAIRVGSETTAATIAAGNGTVQLGTYSRRGAVVVNNSKTAIDGVNIVVAAGNNGTVNPSFIHLEGTYTATGNVKAASNYDAELVNARIVGDTGVDLSATNDLSSNNATLVARQGGVQFKADSDGDKAGTALAVDTRVSQPGSLDLRTRVNETRLPARVVPGSRGETYVVIGNNAKQAVTGVATVYVYASDDGVLDASDRVIGYVRKKLTLAAGETATLKVLLRLPSDLATGRYRLVAEATPYGTQGAANVSTGDTFAVVAA